MKQVVTLRI